jgi:glucose-6-phosphate isomerase
MDLPVDYDKEEFARILNAAERIKKSCDILVVIGIGGSYLGARAAIEFVKSPLYNNLKKDTPDIYFSGNNISAAALSEQNPHTQRLLAQLPPFAQFALRA